LSASLIGRFESSTFKPSTTTFQTIHHCSVDVAHGLVLLFGIGAKALPLWDSRTRRNILLGGLTVSVTAGPSGQTNSPHPSSREGHHSTARWSSSVLLSHVIPNLSHATAACSRVQRNSVPSTQMRCMITANRRASGGCRRCWPRRSARQSGQPLVSVGYAARPAVAVDLHALDRRPDAAVTGLIPALLCRSCLPNNQRFWARLSRLQCVGWSLEAGLELAAFHSITSSARAITVVGISRPIAFAVFRLITNSKVTGWAKGR